MKCLASLTAAAAAILTLLARGTTAMPASSSAVHTPSQHQGIPIIRLEANHAIVTRTIAAASLRALPAPTGTSNENHQPTTEPNPPHQDTTYAHFVRFLTMYGSILVIAVCIAAVCSILVNIIGKQRARSTAARGTMATHGGIDHGVRRE